MAIIAQKRLLYETKAMLLSSAPMKTAQAMAAKLSEAIKNTGIRNIEIAEACGVSKQAVQGWVKTGRIDKKHLPKLAELTKLPLDWWLDADPAPADTPNSYATSALARLAVIGRGLSEKDWAFLVATATHLASQAQHSGHAPQPSVTGGVIAPDKHAEMAELQAKAEELHAEKHPTKQRRRTA